MQKQMQDKLNRQRGSATVEAVIAFVGFLFTVFTILSMVNFCRAQMLVSAAVDSAAQELSQYAYFYKMSGLQKFNEKVTGQATLGKNNINQVISTVDSLYSSLGGAVKGTAEEVTNLADVTQKGNLELTDIETAMNNIKTDGTNIANDIQSMSNAFESIGDDPLLYMRSLVSIAGQEGMELAKRAIASPLAKAFVQKHFGGSRAEANEALEKLGIEGGLDAMNFNLSTMFSGTYADGSASEDIELVVVYKVKLIQIFKWDMYEATVSKKAICRAWLGGDNVQKQVDPEQTVAFDEPKKDPAEGDGEGENPEGEEKTEEEKTEEEKPEDKPTVDTTGSYWHIGEDGYGYEDAGRDNAFWKEFKEDYQISDETAGSPATIYTSKTDNSYYGYEIFTGEKGKDIDLVSFIEGMKNIKDDQTGGEIGKEMGQYTYIVYVPENISDEAYAEIEKEVKSVTNTYNMMRNDPESSKQLPENISGGIQIVKAGGNFDYGSEG